MLIQTKYDMSEVVLINAIGYPATIVEIRLSGLNLIYKLEYWMDGKICVVEQDEWQLSKHIKNDRSPGF